MKPQIIESDNSVLIDDIKLIEAKYNIILPQDYIKFILDNNGGYPEPDIFMYKGNVDKSKLLSPDECIPINYFYNIASLESPNEENQNPDGWFGIAYVGSMNLVCISLNKDNYGSIYVTNYILTDTPKEPMTWHLLIANNFTEFINGFEEDPDD